MARDKTSPSAINITQVANGYQVVVVRGAAQGENFFVFQTFRELTAWLRQHFGHRNSSVQLDVAND